MSQKPQMVLLGVGAVCLLLFVLRGPQEPDQSPPVASGRSMQPVPLPRHGRPSAAAKHPVQSPADDEDDDLVLSRLATKKQTLSISGSKQKKIPVTVVDEHMHVLPYWFDQGTQAAPLGATLVHIDGHSDMASPRRMAAGWPSGTSARGLCENDEFILLSIMKGQIANVVFIGPDWTMGADSISTKTFKVGVIRNRPEVFCICWSKARSCRNGFDKSVARSECKIQREGSYITVGQNYVLQNGIPLVSSGILPLTPDSKVILDIDLDFFGCDSPLVSMVEAGMPQRVLEYLQKHLLELGMCVARPSRPGSTQLVLDTDAEQRIDRLLRLVALKMAVKTSPTKDQLETELGLHGEELKAIASDIQGCSELAGLKRRRRKSLVAELRKGIASAFTAAAAQDEDGDLSAGFRVVARYGFCIDTEEYPRTSFKMGVCVGSSDYDDANGERIEMHRPSRVQIDQAKLTMSGLIKRLGDIVPLMVTVCRSLRDGYTPREYWHELERSVLNDVSKMAARASRSTKVTFDRDLFNGEEGWSSDEPFTLAKH